MPSSPWRSLTRTTRWEDATALAVVPLLTADPLHVGIWTRALSPVQKHLIGPLSVTFADPLLPAEHRVAANVLRRTPRTTRSCS